MGRYWTGAKVNREIERINLTELLRKDYIKKGAIRSGSIQWENGSSLTYLADLRGELKYLRLSYVLNSETGPSNQDYLINIVSVPSNLGKGKLLYFECPQSGQRCRILYRAYGSPIWKSRLAYSNRIYYEVQLASKRFRDSTRLFLLEEKLAKLMTKQYVKLIYKGKPTRTAKRMQALIRKMDTLESDSSILTLMI